MPENKIKKMEMLGDNEISFTLTKDSICQNWRKYIYVIYYYAHGLVEDKKLAI